MDISTSEAVSNLATSLTKAQAEFKGVAKSGQNTYDKYAYATLEDFVGASRAVLAKYGLSLVTSVLAVEPLPDRTTGGGKTEHVVRVKVALRLIHESGEWIEATSWGEGQDRADKAVYKAITGARKYGLASMLGLATTDDPEADETVGRDTVQPKAAPSPSQMPPPKPAPSKTGDVPLAPPTNVAADLPQEPSVSESPPPAGGLSDVAEDAALTQAEGPCVDCGKDYLMDKVAAFVAAARKRGGSVRWSHTAIKSLGCSKAQDIAEKQKR